MLGYVTESLHQFSYKTPKKPQHQTYPSPENKFRADAQKINQSTRPITIKVESKKN